ncbi:acyltransferase [Novosphingobium sp. Fuku2-ISO-50]|nr:acyltransferase [Novosphingobium sp. Fuku2-ISO-50]
MRRPLPALTGVRFFAAAAVLLFHYGAGFSDRIHAPSPIRHVLHNGYLGVSLFFVLSGFIIAYSHFTESMSAPVVGRFLWARIARIYPVYLLALILALPVLEKPLTPGDALSVLTMTQAWTVPSSGHGFAWVMQAWTLSIEAAFYLLFPLFWPLVRRLGRNGTIALAIAAAALIIAFGTPSISPGVHVVPFLGTDTQIPMPLFRMAEFAYGMALCQMFVRWPPTLSPRTAGIAELGLVAAMLITLASAEAMQTKAIFTVLAGIFILISAQGVGAVTCILSTRALLLLGGASYAIYILQQPLHSLCSLLVRSPFDQVISPIVTIVGAILAFQWIEQPARRFLINLVRKSG